MDQVWLKNFRCFREKQTARVAPLTLLVGENSTGKTSFMALIRTLWDAAYLHMNPNFKEAPYDLGSFDEVAHYRGGRGGRAPEFIAGFDAATSLRSRRPAAPESAGRSHSFEVTFGRQGTAPVPVESRFEGEDVAITDRVSEDMSRVLRLRTSRGEWTWQVPAEVAARFGAGGNATPRTFLSLTLTGARNVKPVGDSPKFTSEDRGRLERLLVEFGEFGEFGISVPGQRPFASAPVRSKPRRTYDPSRPARDPEGETIPRYLSTAYFEDERAWRALKEDLEKFGRDAGLFDEISVKPLDSGAANPSRCTSGDSDAAPRDPRAT